MEGNGVGRVCDVIPSDGYATDDVTHVRDIPANEDRSIFRLIFNVLES